MHSYKLRKNSSGSRQGREKIQLKNMATHRRYIHMHTMYRETK